MRAALADITRVIEIDAQPHTRVTMIAHAAFSVVGVLPHPMPPFDVLAGARCIGRLHALCDVELVKAHTLVE